MFYPERSRAFNIECPSGTQLTTSIEKEWCWSSVNQAYFREGPEIVKDTEGNVISGKCFSADSESPLFLCTNRAGNTVSKIFCCDDPGKQFKPVKQADGSSSKQSTNDHFPIGCPEDSAINEAKDEKGKLTSIWCETKGKKSGIFVEFSDPLDPKGRFTCFENDQVVKSEICSSKDAGNDVIKYRCCKENSKSQSALSETCPQIGLNYPGQEKITFFQCPIKDPVWETHMLQQQAKANATYLYNQEHYPCFAPFNRLQRDLVLALVNKYNYRFCFLSRNFPQKIKRYLNLYQFGSAPLSNAWTQKDENLLMTKEPDYKGASILSNTLEEVAKKYENLGNLRFTSTPVNRPPSEEQSKAREQANNLSREVNVMFEKAKVEFLGSKDFCHDQRVNQMNAELLREAERCQLLPIYIPCFEANGQYTEASAELQALIPGNVERNKESCRDPSRHETECCRNFR